MTKRKLIASHYTTAQMARILDIHYNRIRSVLARVPKCRVDVVGTAMIPATLIPKLRSVVQDMDREARKGAK